MNLRFEEEVDEGVVLCICSLLDLFIFRIQFYSVINIVHALFLLKKLTYEILILNHFITCNSLTRYREAKRRSLR